MGLRSAYPARYPPFRAASMRPPCGSRRRLWDFRTDPWAPWPLRIGLAGSYTNLINPIKSVAGRHVVGGIAQSPHGYHAEAACSKTARWRHGHCTIFPQPLHGLLISGNFLKSGTSTSVMWFPTLSAWHLATGLPSPLYPYILPLQR